MTEQPGAGSKADPRKTIAATAAIISGLSALATGTFGYSHAKAAYEAAKGTTAGLEDYITVGRAFWDAAPIAAAVAVLVALMMKGHASAALYPFAGFLLLAGGYVASTVDPAAHLQKFYDVVASNPQGTPAIAGAFIAAYGGLTALLAAIAGGGVAVSLVQLVDMT